MREVFISGSPTMSPPVLWIHCPFVSLKVDEFEDDVVPQGGSLEFTDAEQNNTPIVLNSSALFHQQNERANGGGGAQTT